MSLDISHFYFNTASHVFTINGYETSLPPKKSKRKDSLCFRNDNHVILNGTKCSEESPAMIAGGDSSYSFGMTSSISGSLTGGFLAYARNDRRGTTRTRAERFK